jgi:hypothetical protein
MDGVLQIDPEQLAALRRLRAAFGEVEVLEVIDDTSVTVAPAAQGWLFEEEGDDDGPWPDESPRSTLRPASRSPRPLTLRDRPPPWRCCLSSSGRTGKPPARPANTKDGTPNEAAAGDGRRDLVVPHSTFSDCDARLDNFLHHCVASADPPDPGALLG